MSLRFAYTLDPMNRPVLSLGGRFVRPRPILGVTLFGPSDARMRDALLDTGADETVFPEELAAKVGVDLTMAPSGTARVIGHSLVPVRYAEVTLRITDGRERREWVGWVGFPSARMNRPLLAFAGFLQFFTATFLGDHEAVELTVNALYRGK